MYSVSLVYKNIALCIVCAKGDEFINVVCANAISLPHADKDSA